MFIDLAEDAAGVALVRLNRAPVNAFNEAFWRELGETFIRLSRSPSVRCIVLASKLDKAFTAGLDLSDTDTLNGESKLDVARKALSLHEHVEDFQRAISSIASCQKPVIAAIHGLCIGLGVDISSACDIRLAAENAVFSIAEVNVGLAADIGTLQRFPKVIGNDSIARELALTGRKFGADEALRLGFVSAVVKGSRAEVQDAAMKKAMEIARKSPIAVLGTKRIMNYSRDHSVQDGLEYTAAWNMSMLQSQDMQESLQAWTSKGKPTRYANLDGAVSKL